MPKAFLLTHKRYDLYNLNVPRLWKRERKEEADCARKISGNKPALIIDDNKNEESAQENFTKYNSAKISKENDCIAKDEERFECEEPVNLSIRKLDLFNLTQLAEVSLATASSSVFPCTEEKDGTLRQICPLCGRGFSTLSNLARHRQTHRSFESSSVKKCPHCDKVYVSIPAFSMHLRTHNQGCKCTYCGKGFSRPWLLQGHIRTHTGEKPFKCQICGKAFADKSNLRAHIQTHSTEKPFICSRCGKTFALKSYLCKHIESSCMKNIRRVPEGLSTAACASSPISAFGEGDVSDSN